MYLFAGYAYRKWSIKRRGPYFIFHVKGQLRLLEGGAFFNYRQNTEGNIEKTQTWFLKRYGFDISF